MRNSVIMCAALAFICSCSTGGAKEAGSMTLSREEVIFEIIGDSITGTILENPPWNFQKLFPLGPGVVVNSGDILRIDVKAVSDRNIGLLQAFIVDQVDGTGWKVLSGYNPLYKNIIAEQEFSLSKEIKITTTSAGDNINTAFYADYDAVEIEPTITFSEFTIIRIPK